jgi:dTMP kinase
LLDIPTQKGLGRKPSATNDRFEAEDIVFHNKVRDGYLKLAAEEPERWLVIDATLPRARIGKIIWHRVNQLLQTEKTSRHE